MKRPPLRPSAALAAAALLVAACQPAPQALGALSDPREIVVAGVSSFAKTQTVHAHADVVIEMTLQDIGPGQAMTANATLDADVDLVRRNIAARTTIAMGAGFDRNQVSEMILVGGQQFSRTPPDTRWTRFPMFDNQVMFPTNQEIADTVNGSLDGAGVVLRLADPAPCGEATCYHVVAELDPNAAWQMLGPILGAGGALPPGMNLDPITVDILVDQGTRTLMGLDAAVTVAGSKTTIRLTLSNHDIPIAISAPPANLVDEIDGGFGGGGMDGGGGVVTMTLAPVPAESP